MMMMKDICKDRARTDRKREREGLHSLKKRRRERFKEQTGREKVINYSRDGERVADRSLWESAKYLRRGKKRRFSLQRVKMED